MRLWSIDPKYLDAKGIVALWREGLLAQKVLEDKTKGYRHHSQLIRFKSHPAPVSAIAQYLHIVCDEATRRGYNFDRSRICIQQTDASPISVTFGQLKFEWNHLLKKIRVRAPQILDSLESVKNIDPHPLFTPIEGNVESWEIL